MSVKTGSVTALHILFSNRCPSIVHPKLGAMAWTRNDSIAVSRFLAVLSQLSRSTNVRCWRLPRRPSRGPQDNVCLSPVHSSKRLFRVETWSSHECSEGTTKYSVPSVSLHSKRASCTVVRVEDAVVVVTVVLPVDEGVDVALVVAVEEGDAVTRVLAVDVAVVESVLVAEADAVLVAVLVADDVWDTLCVVVPVIVAVVDALDAAVEVTVLETVAETVDVAVELAVVVAVELAVVVADEVALDDCDEVTLDDWDVVAVEVTLEVAVVLAVADADDVAVDDRLEEPVVDCDDDAVEEGDDVAVVVTVVTSQFLNSPKFIERMASFNCSAVRSQSPGSEKWIPSAHSRVAACPGGPLNSLTMSFKAAAVVEHLLSSAKMAMLPLSAQETFPASPGQCTNRSFSMAA